MRRTAADFKRETNDDPYELELESGTVVEMRTSRDAPMSLTDDIMAWQPEHGAPRPIEMQARWTAGDHADEFWAEWREKPLWQLQDMIEECDKHYADGLEQGKETSSTGSSNGTGPKSKRTSASGSKST